MKTVITLAFLLMFITSWGQDVVKKKVNNELPPYKETYYVLKDNPEIKHGAYTKSARGFSVKGQYENNARAGVWEFTGRSGRLTQRIDFTTGTVTQLEPMHPSWQMKILSDTPDEEPVLIGGMDFLMYHFRSLLRYPAEARRTGVDGTVWISATITQDGKMIDEKVEEGPDRGLHAEALRVMQLLPDDWIPGKVDGQPVDVRISLPVKFRLM